MGKQVPSRQRTIRLSTTQWDNIELQAEKLGVTDNKMIEIAVMFGVRAIDISLNAIDRDLGDLQAEDFPLLKLVN